jgi:ElaB/YqjD/DUF883 family membrane-anchored ribosome-binding protein
VRRYSFHELGHASARLIQEKTKAFMETRSASDIEESTEKLLQDLKEVVRDGEELLRAGAEELGERGSAAREKLTAALEIAKETQRRLQERAVAGARPPIATFVAIPTSPSALLLAWECFWACWYHAEND